MSRFERRSLVRGSPAQVEAWHRRDGALDRLLPPWTGARVLFGPRAAVLGARVELRLPIGPLPLRWVSEVRPLQEERGFRDIQVRGPFRRWVHDHRFMDPGPGEDHAGETDDGRCAVVDRISYDLPFGRIGRMLGEGSVQDHLERSFAYRHRTLDFDLAAHARYPMTSRHGAEAADPAKEGESRGPHGPGEETYHVAVSGSTGLVGSSLVAFLRTGGYRVSRLVRHEPAGPDEIRWVPEEGLARPESMEAVDAVVHLAGESIMGFWTAGKRRRIEESRVPATRRLCRDLASLGSPPDVFVSSSGVNYYGDRGEERLTEASGSGEGFLAGVCRGWEEASRPLEEAGCRVVRLRFGMVLTPAGGALATMLPVFRAGLGGPLGDGDQFMAWIALDDLLDVILHSLADPDLSGSVNAVAPRPVRNREFAETLARVLRRPAAFRVPAPMLGRVGGQMARELLLASLRVEPAALEEANHRYRHPELEGALRHLLGRMAT